MFKSDFGHMIRDNKVRILTMSSVIPNNIRRKIGSKYIKKSKEEEIEIDPLEICLKFGLRTTAGEKVSSQTIKLNELSEEFYYAVLKQIM